MASAGGARRLSISSWPVHAALIVGRDGEFPSLLPLRDKNMQLNENKPHSPRLLPTHDESARLLGKNDTSPSAGMTSAYGDSEGILLSLFCFIVLIPCMLAACAQSIYCVKKRRQDRIERQLLAVSTNPTSRMLVLSEIFKDDGRVSDN